MQSIVFCAEHFIMFKPW